MKTDTDFTPCVKAGVSRGLRGGEVLSVLWCGSVGAV